MPFEAAVDAAEHEATLVYIHLNASGQRCAKLVAEARFMRANTDVYHIIATIR